MANSYFQFKQFTVQQNNCAMKVCTDACLFGAWLASIIKQQQVVTKKILDIGTGTGLLSLMIAQKSMATIDGVEIDKDAFLQSIENIENSPFKKRINIINIDANKFKPDKKYDWIISNPPFFENDLKSENAKKNAAKHDTALLLSSLLILVKNILKADGNFAVLLPFSRLAACVQEAKNAGLFIQIKTLVKQTPGHPYFRGMLVFSNIKNNTPVCNELSIKNNENQYTIEFTQLLQDYYLYL